VIIPRNFARIWYDLLKKSGLRRIRFHDLHHLHVSLLIDNGLDPRSVTDRIGHADPSFTMKKYAHAFEARRRVAAVPMTKLLEAHKEEENDT
jgi:integrase